MSVQQTTATNSCCYENNFVVTKVLSRQCATKHVFVLTEPHLLLWQKYVTTKLLSQQTFFSLQNFCCDEHLSWQTSFCCDNSFVTTKKNSVVTNTCLLQQIFVTTKVILVAAPASDNQPCHHLSALKVHRFSGHSNTLYKAAIIRSKLHMTWEQKVCWRAENSAK